MSALIKQLSSDKIVWWSILASLGCLLLSLSFIFLFYKALPPVLPLYNQLPWGTERLGPKLRLLIPVVICFAFLLSNAIISNYVYEKIPVLARILNVTTFLIALLTAVFVFRIIRLVI